MASKRCPSCRLVNPGSAQTCDCGYSFATGTSPELGEDGVREVTPRQSVRQVAMVCLIAGIAVLVVGGFVAMAAHDMFYKQVGGGLAIMGVLLMGLARGLFRVT